MNVRVNPHVIHPDVVREMVFLLGFCKRNHIYFSDCLAEARKQYQRETREAALKEQP